MWHYWIALNLDYNSINLRQTLSYGQLIQIDTKTTESLRAMECLYNTNLIMINFVVLKHLLCNFM